MLNVIPPPGLTHVYDASTEHGEVYTTYTDPDGTCRIKIPAPLFRQMISDARNGGAWAALNSELIAQLAVAA
jgi:hypothetical protein